MTQTFLTSQANHDLYLLPNGNLAIGNGVQAVESACETASLLSLGEAVLQTTLGIPFFQSVFVGNPNVAVFENYLRKAIISVDGVTAIQSLTVTVTKNTLSYVCTLQTVYGQTTINSGEISP